MFPKSGSSQFLLQVDKVEKHFGCFRALDGVSFDLRPGQVLGPVGPNGSGKTTCINVISGLYPGDGGQVVFEGARIDGIPMHRLARRGINRTFQSPKPFLSLTVRENVEISAKYGHAAGEHAGKQVDLDALLASLDLDAHAGCAAEDLNSAQQKTLDLARALATAPGYCWSTSWQPGSIRPNSAAWLCACAGSPMAAWRCSWWSI